MFSLLKCLNLTFSPSPIWQITVLQLSTLLKQADSSKRKLTLTRLASAPVPFTVLSLTGNPCNEDYLAVCGLKVRNELLLVKQMNSCCRNLLNLTILFFSFHLFPGLPCTNFQQHRFCVWPPGAASTTGHWQLYHQSYLVTRLTDWTCHHHCWLCQGIY